jgi:hypothetical protein
MRTSFCVPPSCLPLALRRLIGMSGLITDCLTSDNFGTVCLFLNALFSFGRHTTVRNEHQIIFSGKSR